MRATSAWPTAARLVIIALVLGGLACNGDGGTGPALGDLQVSAATTGPDPDADGYTVTLDGTTNRAIGSNASVSFADLEAGDYAVELSGVAANCAVSGQNPRTVTVTSDQTASTTFSVACVANAGNLQIATTTTGNNLDPDGYVVTVDGAQSQNIGVNASVTFNALATGDHSVQLSAVASNCTLTGSNPRTVTVPFNATAQLSLVIVCTANVGDLRVTTTTTGTDLDPDGYSVRVDGTLIQNIGLNGSVIFTNLAATDHTVELIGAAANCSADGNPRTVGVAFNDTTDTAFDVACVANVGSIQVTTATTGTDPDPDGYTISVDGGAPQAVGPNASVTFSGLAVGNHSVELAGEAANCAVGEGNPQTVGVTFNDTTQTAFNVTCVANLGSIQVTASTGGIDPDVDGYAVSVDGGTPQALGSNGSVTFDGLAVGDHSVELLGASVQANCTVGGDNPRTVGVAFADTTPTTFSVTCVDNVGSLQVTTQTTGSPPDPDGYRVVIDAVDQGAINANQTRTFSGLDVGDHTLELSGLAANCYVNGNEQQTVAVSFADTTPATVQVTCFTPLSNKIVFESDREGNFEIYVMDTLGFGLTRLTNDPASDREPSVSPDGLKIAFTHAGQIWVMNADGSKPAAVVSTGSNFAPAWSPDGTKLALTRVAGGNTDVYVVNANGTGLTRLTTDAAVDQFPTWSPDGSRIAFISERDLNREVYVMNADGSGQTNVTNDPGSDSQPVWSSTGLIAFHSSRGGALSDIFVMNPDGSGLTNLTSDEVERDYSAAWSPNGSKIVFTSERHLNPEIYIMNADGTNVVRLTVEAATDGQATFSP